MKRKYTAPQSEIVRCEHLCETIVVHFSKEGTGVVDAKEMNFDDFFDKNFLPSEFNDIWEE